MVNLEKHHIFFGAANRKLSDQYGLWVWLCADCHRNGPHAVHRDYDTNLKLKQDGQKAFERSSTRERFMSIFGRNYLD